MGTRKILIGLLSAIGAVVTMAVVFLSLALSGTLPMLKNKIVIQSDTYTKVYDGTAVDNDSYSITSGTLYSGDTLEVTFITVASDVGTYTNDFDVKIVNKNGHDVTSNYDVKTVFGKLTITARPMTLKVVGKSEPYDGKKLTASEYEAVDVKLAEGETLEVYYDGEISDVGEETATIIPHVYTQDKRDVTSNYKITTIDGTLVKTPINLTLTSHTIRKNYDGKELKDEAKEPFEMEGKLIEGDVLNYTPTTSLIDAGEAENLFNATVSNGDKDVTYRYNIRKNYGKLSVDPLAVTFASKDHYDLTYTGVAIDFTNEELEQKSDIAETDELTVTFTTNSVNAGTYSNKFFVSIKSKGEESRDVISNYKITLSYGVIEILPISLKVKTPEATKVYDGSARGGWNTTNSIIKYFTYEGTLAEGNSASASYRDITANVGTYQNIATIKIVDAMNQNVTSNYDIEYEYGVLTILPRKLVIQASSASKQYNSSNPTTLTSPDWYWISGTTAEGEYLAGDTFGSQTTPGTSDNNITWRITDENGVKLSNASLNYNVEIIKGKLTVYEAEKNVATLTPKSLTMSEADLAVVGGSMTSDGITGFESYTLAGYAITYDFTDNVDGTGRLTAAGVKTIMVDDSSIHVTKGGVDVTGDFQFDYGSAVIRVYKEKFEITTDTPVIVDPDDSTKTSLKQYDGTALQSDKVTMEGIEYSGGTISFTRDTKNYEITYINTSSQTVVGQSLNKITITGLTIDSVAVAQDKMFTEYLFEITYGTLTVTRKQITVKTNSNTAYVADGATEVSANSFAPIDGLATGDTAYVKKNDKLTAVGSKENQIEVGIKDSEGNDVSSYYIILYEYGTLTLI